MKKKPLSLILAFILGLNCFAVFPGGNDQEAQFERDQKINEFLKKELVAFLEIIPEGFEEQHGFHSRTEFSKAIAGPVYTIMGVDINGKVFATNRFNVPVVVDDTYRAMITVSVVNGTCELETVGAAQLAGELQALEKAHPVAGNQEKILLHVYSKTSSFVAYREMNTAGMEQADFIPLASAKTSLATAEKAIRPSYKLEELIQTLRVGE